MEEVIIFYDVTDDALRLAVSELLKDFGLERIQKSAFHGFIKDDKLLELQAKLEKMITTDLIHIIKLCQRCRKRVVEVGFAMTPSKRDIYVF